MLNKNKPTPPPHIAEEFEPMVAVMLGCSTLMLLITVIGAVFALIMS